MESTKEARVDRETSAQLALNTQHCLDASWQFHVGDGMCYRWMNAKTPPMNFFDCAAVCEIGEEVRNQTSYLESNSKDHNYIEAIHATIVTDSNWDLVRESIQTDKTKRLHASVFLPGPDNRRFLERNSALFPAIRER